jgi:hypothetical protein
LRTNYVLIDFENIQPDNLETLEQDCFKLLVFVGASQCKVPFETAAALQRMGSNAEYIKVPANGPNALDFHIAFYIGQLAATEPAAYFHIISKDTGFDPLIQHLKNKKILAGRVQDVTEIPLLKAAKTKSPGERIAMVAAKLQQLKSAKPRTVKSLGSTIASLFQKQLSESEISSVIEGLRATGLLSVNDTKISYAFPDDG